MDRQAVEAVQSAVNILMNNNPRCTVAEALTRIIQTSAGDLAGYARELAPW